MKPKALKAGQKVFFVSDEVGLFSATVKDVEYDLDDDGNKQKDKIVVKLILEANTYAVRK